LPGAAAADALKLQQDSIAAAMEKMRQDSIAAAEAAVVD
jgi:hypothetical protein